MIRSSRVPSIPSTAPTTSASTTCPTGSFRRRRNVCCAASAAITDGRRDRPRGQRRFIDPIGQTWTPFAFVRGERQLRQLRHVAHLSGLSTTSASRSTNASQGGFIGSNNVARGTVAARRRPRISLSLLRRDAVRIDHRRADRADHRPPRSRPRQQFARQHRFAEPRLRRLQSVHLEQILRLRPVRDRHPR